MIEVIYEDKDVLAVNKPPGIIVFHEKENSEGDSLATRVVKEFPQLEKVGKERRGAVHRLDKETSGVVLFAKNNTSLAFFQKQLLEKKAKKRYITLVFKTLKKDEGEINTFIDRSPKDRRKQRALTNKEGKREAVTFFKVLERLRDYTLVEVFPKTGRKHQIRCHLSFIGHPVVGDRLYSFKDQKKPACLKRHFLHAESIEIKLTSGQLKKICAPLSEDLEGVLKLLRKNNFKLEK
jgi:23S rRNA pseudouridine1911/1915/1917 synthase